MRKLLIHLIALICFITSNAQTANQKILYILDSIPIINDPESWNQIEPGDISDITVIKNKDSVHRLGWENVDGIIYIFTKAYRSRPDSIKKIPGLKQMVYTSDAWYLNGKIYSGHYIDYFNNGNIQDEGSLLNGKLHGQLIVYFKSGIKKTVAEYAYGKENGPKTDYYKNGSLYMSREYVDGKETNDKTYYYNGQIQTVVKVKRKTSFDTVISYYSTGKVCKQALRRDGSIVINKKQHDINYYSTMLSQSLRTGDIKEANRLFYRLWLLDSSSLETKLQQGILAIHEARYDDAIAALDEALELEPLLRPALEQRAVARIRKNVALKAIGYSRPVVQFQVTIDDLMMLPEDELRLVCEDLLKSDDLDPNDVHPYRIVPEAVLNFCRDKKIDNYK